MWMKTPKFPLVLVWRPTAPCFDNCPHDFWLPVDNFSSGFNRSRSPSVIQSILPHHHSSLLISVFLSPLKICLSFLVSFRKFRLLGHTVMASRRITIFRSIPRFFPAARVDLYSMLLHNFTSIWVWNFDSLSMIKSKIPSSLHQSRILSPKSSRSIFPSMDGCSNFSSRQAHYFYSVIDAYSTPISRSSALSHLDTTYCRNILITREFQHIPHKFMKCGVCLSTASTWIYSYLICSWNMDYQCKFHQIAFSV